MDEPSKPNEDSQRPTELGLGSDAGYLSANASRGPMPASTGEETPPVVAANEESQTTGSRRKKIVVGLVMLLFLIGGMGLGLRSIKESQTTREKAAVVTGPPTATPAPTCMPRPACLDTKPYPCEVLPPEGGWCPTPTPTLTATTTPTTTHPATSKPVKTVRPATPEPTVVPAGFSLPTWGIFVAATFVVVGGVLLFGL